MNNEEKWYYIQQNVEPIEIEYVEDEHDEEKDFQPSFWFENQRYYLDDFTRTHNSPFVSGDFPEYIHGFESESYYHPLYIELIADTHVNVFRYKPLSEYESYALWDLEFKSGKGERKILIPKMSDLIEFLNNQYGYRADIRTDYGQRIIVE